MCSKQEVIEPHGCLWRFRIPERVLRLNRGRVEEGGCGDRIGSKSQHVKGGKIYSETEGRLSFPVRNGLRIERCAPAQS